MTERGKTPAWSETRAESVLSLNDSEYTRVDTSYSGVSHDKQRASDPERTSASASRPSIFSPRAWLYEILSLCVAIAVLSGLIAILATYNHKPNPDWTKKVTLNTVVSIGSAVFRISLMIPVVECITQLKWVWFSKGQRPLGDIHLFDNASQGFWGSLNIIFSSAYRSIVSVGAIITIAALALGPFFQQSLVLYTAATPDYSSQAYASTASSYKGNAGNIGAEYGDELPFNMKNAILSGILSSSLSSQPIPPYSCPSGSICNWDPFGTLAVSARCDDISAGFTLDCIPFPEDPDWGTSYVPPNCTITRALDGPAYSPSTKPLVIPSKELYQARGTLPVVFYWANINGWADEALNKELWHDLPSGEVLQMEWLRMTDLHLAFGSEGPYIYPNSTIEAMSCILYTSVHEISARVEDGVYTESVTREITTANEAFVAKGEYVYEYTHENLTSKNFSMSRFEQMVLFEGAEMALRRDQWGTAGVAGIAMGRGGFLSQDNKVPETILTMLYQSANISESIYNLAHHMSIAMRANDTLLEKQILQQNTSKLQQTTSNLTTDVGGDSYVAPSHRVTGTVSVNVLHVAVRWGWLALPMALSFLAFILLATTIFETHHRNVGIWKDSSLALLLNSHWESGLEKRHQSAMTADDIVEGVKGLRATMVGGNEGYGRAGREVNIKMLISKVEV